MRDETDRLQETADSIEAFHAPASDAVHGDLNEGNVVVTPNAWFVVDWDDLALGDPAVEYAVLLWPIICQGGKSSRGSNTRRRWKDTGRYEMKDCPHFGIWRTSEYSTSLRSDRGARRANGILEPAERGSSSAAVARGRIV